MKKQKRTKDERTAMILSLWDEGQFYTGVSRCKKIENICFMQPVKTKYIVSSDEVIKEFAR